MLTAAAVNEFVASGSDTLDFADEPGRDPWKRLWGILAAARNGGAPHAGAAAAAGVGADGRDACSAAEGGSLGDSVSCGSNGELLDRHASVFSLEDDASAEFSTDYDSLSETQMQAGAQPVSGASMVVSAAAGAKILSQEAAALPWCNGQAFGLLIHAFSNCDTDFRLRKHLLNCLLFALVRFPRQYLRHQQAYSLWFYHPLMVVSKKYHIELDAAMQSGFLACAHGLATYALKQLADDQRTIIHGAPSLLHEALIFDLKCVLQLLSPPSTDSPLTFAQGGCGRWFLEGYERVLACVLRLQEAGTPDVFEALRVAGLCEVVAALLKSRFGWGNSGFISSVVSILYRQCKRDRASVQHLLDSCHNILLDLFALMMYLPPSAPSTFMHFRSVTSLLYLIAPKHDIVDCLLAVSELAPVGLHPDAAVEKLSLRIACPHCAAEATRSAGQPYRRPRKEPCEATPECPEQLLSSAACSHRQHPHIRPADAAATSVVPDSPLKTAQLRRRVAQALVKLFQKTRCAAADFRACGGFARICDACERDAAQGCGLVAALVEAVGCPPGCFVGLHEGIGVVDAIVANTNAFERSESGLAGGQEGKDLLWYLLGNLLTYMAVATAAASAGGPQGAAAVEEAHMGERLAKAFGGLRDPILPGSKILLALGLLRLALHATTLPLPDEVFTQAILKHHRLPTSIDVECTLPSDRHHFWTIYHPSVLKAAMSMTVPASADMVEAHWSVSSMLHRHVLDVVKMVTAATAHNALDLHRDGFIRSFMEVMFPLLRQRRDDDLCAAVFDVVRCVARRQCGTDDAKFVMQHANDEHLGSHCLQTLRHWAAYDNPSSTGPHHYISFPGYKDGHDIAPVAALPKLSVLRWPCPNRGYTLSMWVRFETLDLATNAATSTTTLQSAFCYDDTGVCLVTDICLTTHAAGTAEIEFRVCMTDDLDETAPQYYHATASRLQRLKPCKWYHLTVTHGLDQQKGYDSVAHIFDVRLNGGMRDGSKGVARINVKHGKKDKFKKFAGKGGTLTSMILGGSLMDVLLGSPSVGGARGDSTIQRMLNLLREDALEQACQRMCQRSGTFASVQLGSMMMFWGTLSEWQAHLLCSMGRDYCGDLHEPLQTYHCHGILHNRPGEVCSSPVSSTRKAASEWLSSAVGMAEGVQPQRAGDLHERLIMVISSRSGIGGAFVAGKVVTERPRREHRGTQVHTAAAAAAALRESSSRASTPRPPSAATTTTNGLTTTSLASTTAASSGGAPGGPPYDARASDDEDEGTSLTPTDLDSRRKHWASSVPVVKASAATKITNYAAVSLSLYGSCVSQSSRTFKSILRAVGGVNSIVSLFSLAKTHAARVAALGLIAELMAYSPENTQDMAQGGYLALAWYLKKRRVTLDMPLLEGCFALAGIEAESASTCVVQDITAIKLILLDWGIWHRADHTVQRTLLSTLASLVMTHPLGRAHRRLFLHAGVVPWLLRLTYSHTAYPEPFSPRLRGSVLQLLNALSGCSAHNHVEQRHHKGAPKRSFAPPAEALASLYRHFVVTWPNGAQGVYAEDNKWRRGLLSLWVIMMARCGSKEVNNLFGSPGDVETFVALLSDGCSRSRLTLLLCLSVIVQFPTPRKAFLSSGTDHLLHQYCELQSKRRSQFMPDPTLDQLEPSVQELQMLLLLLTRGPASTERGSGEPPVKQPLLAHLFVTSFGDFAASAEDLPPGAAKALLQTVKEVLPASGAVPEMPSNPALLHACPPMLESYWLSDVASSSVTPEAAAEETARLLSEHTATLRAKVESGALPDSFPTVVTSHGGASRASMRHSRTEAPKYLELSMPELLSTLLHIAAEPLNPGQQQAAAGGGNPSPLNTANLRFKRCMVVDALRQIFNGGSPSAKQMFIDRQIPALVATLLCPQATCDDQGFAWLSLSFLCDMVSWAVAEPPSAAGGAETHAVLLEQMLSCIAELGKKARDVADRATTYSWVCHLQQHLLHACLLAFRKRLLGPERSAAVLTSFIAFAETCTDTVQEWRLLSRPAESDAASRGGLSPLDDGAEDEDRAELYHLSLLVSCNPSLELTRLLSSQASEARSTRVRSNAVKNSAVRLVWLVPAPMPAKASEQLMAHDWLAEEVGHESASRAGSSPIVKPSVMLDTRARSMHVHQLTRPDATGAAGERVRAVVSELSGSPEEVRTFVFWLFETVHMAVAFAHAVQSSRGTPLKTKMLRTAGLTHAPEAALHKQMKRLLVEMLAAPSSCRITHALRPADESASLFALVTLLRSVALKETPEHDLHTKDTSKLWAPVARLLPASSLLLLFTSKADEDASFVQHLVYHTGLRLRSAGDEELHRLQKVWRFMVETKFSVLKKVLVPQVLEKKNTLPGQCVLYALLMVSGKARGVDQLWAAPPGTPGEDRMLQGEFVQRMRGDTLKAIKRIRKRADERLASSKASARPVERRRGDNAFNSLLAKLRCDYEISAMQGIKQSRSREKEARGAVGRLVQSRVMLQDLWGQASAVYTQTKLRTNWRLDDVEGPDRMRVRLKRGLAKPLVQELGLLTTPDSNGSGKEEEDASPTAVESPSHSGGGSPAPFVRSSSSGSLRDSLRSRSFPSLFPAPVEDDDADDELKALIDHQFEPGMYGPDEACMASEKRLASFPCAQVTPMVRVEGELVLFSKALYYCSNDSPYRDDLEKNSFADDVLAPLSPTTRHSDMKQRKRKMVHRMHLHAVRHRLTAQYAEVSGVFRRRYLLMNNSLEVFTERGLAFFFSFENEGVREKVYADLLAQCHRAKEMSHTAEKLTTWQEKWQRGEITNFQYIMSLNTMAGRSFNDLTQYPVFPHVLADYSSETLDLSDPKVYRDLRRPMGCQTEERRRRAADKFEQTAEMYEMEMANTGTMGVRDSRKAFSQTSSTFRMLSWGKKTEETVDSIDLYALPPYHHGSHFSNRATVLYYCIRMQPFTDYFCELNDLKLDVPDRCFHSMDRAWKLSSAMSSTDVKELTPEFFYLPDFLVNTSNINFGVKQDAATVNHLELPAWAKDNPRLFVELQRQALEGEECSKNLHHWIDLTFGYKAAKESAVEALNCFHPYAYEGAVNIDAIQDPIRRQSTIDIINNFGQMPQQLLTKPHKKRSVELIFHARDVPFWKAKPPERKICDAPYQQHDHKTDRALVLTKSEQHKEVMRSLMALRVEGSSKESTTTRGIDSVAAENADDDVCAVPVNQILLVHTSYEQGSELIGQGEKVLRETLHFLNWDNGLKIRLYESNRAGRDVLTMRQSTRVDPITVAAASGTEAAHVGLGTESGAVEIFHYGWSHNMHAKKAHTLDTWEVEGDREPGFQFTPVSGDRGGDAGYQQLPAACLTVEDVEGRGVRTLQPLATLHGHTSDVVSLVISKEFNVIVSGSMDGLLIVWDLLELTYVRSMTAIREKPSTHQDSWGACRAGGEPPKATRGETMSVVEINPMNGDIVAISTNAGKDAVSYQLNLWNINGVELALRRLEEQAMCVHFSGTLVMVGLITGKVLFLSAFDLTHVSTPLVHKPDCPITALATNEGETKLYVAHQQSSPQGGSRSVITTWVAKSKW